MATDEIDGVLRRVDWAKGFVVIESKSLHRRTIPFDLNPSTPDYRQYVGRDVRCIVEDDSLKSMDLL